MVLRQAFLLSLLGINWAAAGFCRGKAGQQELGTSQHDPLALIAAVCILLVLGVAATFSRRGRRRR